MIEARAAVDAARAAPLSRRKAMLAVLLIDAEADRLAAETGGDVLAFRANLGARSEALALVFDLCAMAADGPRLVLEAVPVEDLAALGIEDLMVSVYNGGTVQRVVIAMPDGTRHDVHAVLAAALAALVAQVEAGL